ncbi:hypothetical protein L218DRAFT_960948 [Marasmius fiardii PR-910]|nr:hypothetical protein L218DRAFT_960948 [Marasmius fiardii PR-910]
MPYLLPSIGFLSLPVISGATMLPSKRASVQSNATCASEFSWMYNRQNISPCWLAAALTGPCQQGDFNVPPLTPSNHYSPPSRASSTATRCTCSWAAYNLYSACTACQNEAGILPWPAYKQDCPSDYLSTDTYWPFDITISGNNTLPFYGGTDPSTWADQRFDVQQARNITNQQHPDLTGRPPSSNDSPKSTKSTTPVGAIAGGVVGGVTVLILAVLAFWWLRRKRNASRRNGGVQELDPGYQRHSFSEVAHKPVFNNSVSYTGSIHPTSTSLNPASPTVYTHNESVQSFSQFGSVSAYTTPHSPPPSRHVTSPAPTMQTTFPTAAPEDHIRPFVLGGPSYSHSNSGHELPVSPRKGELVVLNPTQRVSPSVNREEELGEEGYPFPNTATAGGNANSTADPPAYTQYPAPSEASSHNVATARRELHGHGHRPYPPEKENRSQDSTQSSNTSGTPWTSFGSGDAINTSMASSHVPFGVSRAPAPGEFGQLSMQVQRTAPQRSQTIRSVLDDQEEHIEVA